MRALSFLAALLLACACSSCSDKTDPSPQPEGFPDRRPAKPKTTAEAEPNDSREQAQELAAFPLNVKGELGAADRDFYTFTVEGSGGYLLHAEVDVPGVRVRVLESDGTETEGAVSPERVAAAGVVKGRWHVVVERAAEAGAGPGAYVLELEKTRWARGVEWEPNDKVEKPGEMRPEELRAKEPDPDEKKTSIGIDLAHYRVFGWLAREGDVDCFKVPSKKLPGKAVARFSVAPPKSLRAQLAVYSNGVKVAKATAEAAGEAVVVPALAAIPLRNPVVVCAHAIQGMEPRDRYTIEARLIEPEGAFEMEPNDSPGAATMLERNKELTGYLTDGDEDWFQISGFHEPGVTVTVTAPAGVAMNASLVDAGTRKLSGSVDVAPGETAELRGVTPARLVLRTELQGSAEQTYSLLVAIAKPAGGSQ